MRPGERVFDHLTDEPEAAKFREVARLMRKDQRWSTPSVRDEPQEVSGELYDMDGMMERLAEFMDPGPKDDGAKP